MMALQLLFVVTAVVLGGYAEAEYYQPDKPSKTVAASRKEIVEVETPVIGSEAQEVSVQFGLPACSGMTRLLETHVKNAVILSWRVRDNGPCYDAWSERQEKYSILAHLNNTQSELDRLPWLCSETGDHVSECETQGTNPIFVIRQPRSADYIMLHRITRLAE